MRLGEMLLASGLIDEWQLMLGIRASRRRGEYLGESLVADRFLSESQWLGVLSHHLDVPSIEMSFTGTSRLSGASDVATEIVLGDETVLEAVPSTVARRYGIFPLELKRTQLGYELTIATADPNNADLMDELSWLLQMEIKPVLASRRAISEAIWRFYGDDDDGETGRMPHPDMLPEYRTYSPVLAIA